jgi:hypothetical protein
VARRSLLAVPLLIALGASLPACGEGSGPTTLDGADPDAAVITDEGDGAMVIDGTSHRFTRFACGIGLEGVEQWSAQAATGADATVRHDDGTYAVEVRVPRGGDAPFEVWEGEADPDEGEIDLRDDGVAVRIEVRRVDNGSDDATTAMGLEMTC